MLADRQIKLALDDRARAWLADKGYDPAYGARPLKRVIQQRIQNPLATEILKRELPDGSRVVVDVLDGEFTIRRTDDVETVIETESVI